MTDPGSRTITAAVRLRTALEATAAALAQPDLDALLTAEADLRAAFTDLSLLRGLDTGGRLSVHAELVAAHAALRRARRLGESLGDFARASLTARGENSYGPARPAEQAFTGRGLKVAV